MQRASQNVNGSTSYKFNGNQVNGSGPYALESSNGMNNNTTTASTSQNTNTTAGPAGQNITPPPLSNVTHLNRVSPGGTHFVSSRHSSRTSPGGTVTRQVNVVTRSPGGSTTEQIRTSESHPDEFVVRNETGDMSFNRRTLIGETMPTGETVRDICRRCHCLILDGVAHRCPSTPL
ncbi:hypothetical protein GJ744_008380 [Endocarpon pusillum]|uniref:Uncharacterized protein n=1 Tax=Endocarpon pusillum TaxID=364733 RepID=A0A8H7AHI4_9EURO|nr:hypothetical protein GJ744_008380 [Endocarpon pusillum]